MMHAPENGRPSEYVPEHILIAEERMGRRLARNEHVHHINGVKLDNTPENLMVVTKSQHRLLHRQLETIGYALIKSGHVIFDGTQYVLRSTPSTSPARAGAAPAAARTRHWAGSAASRS